MLRNGALICCALSVLFVLGCKSKEAATEQRVEKTTIEAPKAGDLPPPPNVEAAPEDAVKTESGLACIVVREGSGTEHPSMYDTVTMHQVVWNTEGKMLMSTGNRGEPVEFPVTQSVLPGLREAIELMVEGEKRRCWIPGWLAFGEATKPEEAQAELRPRGMLVYELDLLDLKKATGLPQAPPDVAAVPEDAKRSESGLAWRVLEQGSGDKHPGADSVVSIHYAGWTPEGELFMMSGTQGIPKSSHMRSVIPGWFEGLQMMTVGEKRRFWVPAELAYRGQPGRPSGMVVFDIELVAVAP